VSEKRREGFFVGSLGLSSSGSSFGSYNSLSVSPMVDQMKEHNDLTQSESSDKNSKTVEVSTQSTEDYLNPMSVFNAQHQQLFQNNNFLMESFVSFLWGYSSNNHGKGIMEFRNRYSFAKHVVYSLLKGRTVIIYAQPQNEMAARKLVTALSIFVPGHWHKRPQIIPWQNTRPIKMADLAYNKLVGLSKQHSIPKSVERYVTILDYEMDNVWSVIYSGQFVEELFNYKKQWPDEETFLAHIHQQLFDLGTKACLYYHLFCIGIAYSDENKESKDIPPVEPKKVEPKKLVEEPTKGSGSMQYERTRSVRDKRSLSDSNLASKFHNPIPGAKREASRESLFKRMNIHDGDVDILEHFTEVVKHQQFIELNGIDQVCPPIKLDYSRCVQMHNTFKSKRYSNNP